MQKFYRLYRRRSGVYYAENISNRRQESLKTRDRATAEQLLQAMNAAVQQPMLNLAVARVHLAAHDPKMNVRPWQDVMDAFSQHGRNSTRERSVRAFKSSGFDPIRNQPIVQTTAEAFLKLMKVNGVSLAHYLRRIHNLAINLGWLPWPILHKATWPKPRHTSKRAISQKEYDAIIKAESNKERRHYYELLWEIGSAQMDAAQLTAENIDWINMTLIYNRRKLREEAEPCVLRIGPRLATILRSLPQSGPLFPSIIKTGSKERAAEFRRRCRLLGFKGITLHSFRYSWAERAFRGGYPERFAQAALGHASKAVHRAYSRGARVLCPPLEDYEASTEPKLIPFPLSSGS